MVLKSKLRTFPLILTVFSLIYLYYFVFGILQIIAAFQSEDFSLSMLFTPVIYLVMSIIIIYLINYLFKSSSVKITLTDDNKVIVKSYKLFSSETNEYDLIDVLKISKDIKSRRTLEASRPNTVEIKLRKKEAQKIKLNAFKEIKDVEYDNFIKEFKSRRKNL